MTKQEKIALAVDEVNQAEAIIRLTREDLAKWEKVLELRQENLERLKKS